MLAVVAFRGAPLANAPHTGWMVPPTVESPFPVCCITHGCVASPREGWGVLTLAGCAALTPDGTVPLGAVPELAGAVQAVKTTAALMARNLCRTRFMALWRLPGLVNSTRRPMTSQISQVCSSKASPMPVRPYELPL